MALFSFNHGEQESELEKALEGIPFSGNILFEYHGKGTEKDKKTTTPVYLLPVDAHNDVVYGYLMFDGKLAEVPIGFLRQKNFLFKEYFGLNLEGNLVKEGRVHEAKLYLPLKLTDLLLALGEQKEEKFVPIEGSPFQLFGVEGAQGAYPLILVSETEKGIICRGMHNEGGLLSSYDYQIRRPSDKQIREFLKQLRGIKEDSKPSSQTFHDITTGGKTVDPVRPLESIAKEEINWGEPKSIVAYLDQYLVGQDDAKRVIAVAFSNYMTQVGLGIHPLHKDNVLLIGPSGVGKTYMVSLLAKKASLPMVQTKVTGKSTEGYKGENISTVFEHFRNMTSGDAPYGIIFFDEIDKLARDEWGSGAGFGTRIQDELIGWLEDATVLGDQNEQSPNQGKKNLAYSTRNILFVTAGAFQGAKGYSLADIVQKRLGKGQRQVGFGARQDIQEHDDGYSLQKVRPEDLITYGLKPELVGRLPSLAALHHLTIDDKVRILTTAKRNPMTNYIALLEIKGYHVEVDTDVPTVIAERCPEETGARALTAICNDLFTEILFDPQQYADAQKVIRVTTDVARKLINLYK